jgi:hypothetical protein
MGWARHALWSVFLLAGVATSVGLSLKPRSFSEDGHGHDPAPDGPVALLTVSLDQLMALEIVTAGTTHRFQRDEAGAWRVQDHDTDAHSHPHGKGHRHSHGVKAKHGVVQHASPQDVTAAVQMLGRAKAERTIAEEPFDAARYGLQAPEMVVLAYGQQPTPLARLYVGKVAPDRLSRYVHVPEQRAVVSVPKYHTDALAELVTPAR